MSTVTAEQKKINDVCLHNGTVEGKVMVLIPHSDDEWIGASQLMGGEQEVLLCNMDMNGDDSEELHQKRYLEMERNATHFSRKLILIKDSEQLAKQIDTYKPQYIFIPFFIDWHEEHHEVIRTMDKALGMIQHDAENLKIGMYQVSVPLPEKAVTYYVPMRFGIWLKKWIIFLKAYPSQKSIAYQRFAIHEIINGQFSNSWAAEVYSIWNASSWIKMYRNCVIKKEEKQKLKSNLNDISWIRGYVNVLWNEKLSGKL